MELLILEGPMPAPSEFTPAPFGSAIQRSGNGRPVYQLSIYAESKVGKLHELLKMLAAHEVHVMAMCTLDTTDSAIVRLVVDYTEKAHEIFVKNNLAFDQVEVVAVEVQTEQQLKLVTAALVEAEINIHYIYPFIMRPSGRSGLVLRLDDNELAMEVLRLRQIRVLTEEDIAR